MATMEIPESLCVYYKNKAVRRAVNELVGKLNGAAMPDCDWKEAKNYNQALLMAAQVRADYVALLFNVWETTFGQSDLELLGGSYFHYELMSPHLIWTKEHLEQYYYRGGDPYQGGQCDSLSVALTDMNLELRIHRFDGDSNLIDAQRLRVKGWSTQQGGTGLANDGVRITEFLSAPESVIERFAEDAAKIIEALLEN